MQTSDQLPEEQHGPEIPPVVPEERSGREPEIKSGQESRESGSRAVEESEQAQTTVRDDDDEAVLKGLVYPPPPSFYLKQPPVSIPRSERPVRPVAVVMDNEPGASARPFPAVPAPPDPVVRAPYPQGAYLPPGASPFPPGVSPYAVYGRRQSVALIWVLVGLIVALVLTACALFAWLSYSLFGGAALSINDATNNGPVVINNYYRALQAKDYKQAYSYLSPEGSIKGLTLEQFIARAQQRDTNPGLLYTFQTGDPQIKTSGTEEITSFTIAVTLQRGTGPEYTAHLTMRKVGGQWKIADFDQL
jgi:hypothetical protein